MAQVTSGAVLREARERKGYELTTVARRLRIRPDILRAIEAGDFNAMPPRGYTRNMINAYARLVGLNPTEIVNMYLDEAYANQVQKARGGAPAARFDMGREPRSRRERERSARYDEDIYEDERSSRRRSSSSSYPARDLYDDRTRYSRDDYGITRERVSRAGRSDRDFLSHHSGYSSMPSISLLDDRSRHPRQRLAPSPGLQPQFSYSRGSSWRQRLPLIIAALIIIALIAVIVTFVLGNRGQAANDDVSKLPVSGITDTTQTGDDSAEAAPIVEIAPTSAKVVYEVKSGEDCYVEIYDNGNMSGEQIIGPAERSLEVTGRWQITTWQPDNITVLVDGQKVTLTSNAELGGMYSYTVDFPAILAAWQTAHPVRTSSSATTSTTSSSGTSSN